MAEATITLWHGTTRQRAESIVHNGPQGDYREFAQLDQLPEEFWAVDPTNPNLPAVCGTAEQYATLKARDFPNEGGAVIVEMEVPQSVLDIILQDAWDAGNARVGAYCFRCDTGLRALRAVWPSIVVRLVPLA